MDLGLDSINLASPVSAVKYFAIFSVSPYSEWDNNAVVETQVQKMRIIRLEQ